MAEIGLKTWIILFTNMTVISRGSYCAQGEG